MRDSQKLYNSVPSVLAELDQWHLWREHNGTKLPFQICGNKNAKSNDPETWSSLDDAVDALDDESIAARGFQLAFELATCGLVGLDLDDCRDPETGDTLPWADDLLNRIREFAYIEISPSETGFKAIIHGEKPAGMGSRFKYDEGSKLEVFDHNRFWAWSGNTIVNNLPELRDDETDDQCHWVLSGIMAEHARENAPERPQEAVSERSACNASNNAYERAAAYVGRMDATNGERNNTLLMVVQHARSFQLDPSEVSRLALEWNANLADPLDVDEVARTVDSAYRLEPFEPKEDRPDPNAPLSVDEVREALEEGKQNSIEQPTVYVDKHVPHCEIADEISKHLANHGWPGHFGSPGERIYVRGGRLVKITESHEIVNKGDLSIRELKVVDVQRAISVAVKSLVHKKKGEDTVAVHEPVSKTIAEMIHSEPGHHFKPLGSIHEMPVMLKDGSIVQTDGYSEESGHFMRLKGQSVSIPDEPTLEQAAAAMDELLDIVHDFEFKTDIDKYCWVAMVLTLVGRTAIDGCVPAFPVNANCAGAGKGRLVEFAVQIATASNAHTTGWNRQEEVGKHLAGAILSGARYVYFDNCREPFGGDKIAKNITSRIVSERRLGTNEMIEGPWEAVILATGNNLETLDDMGRRMIPINLFTELAKPQDRTGWKHPNIDKHVKDNQHRLLTSALTLLRTGIVHEESCGIDSWSSFYEWGLVRRAIILAGGPDVVDNALTIDEDGGDNAEIELLCNAVEETRNAQGGVASVGVSVSDMLHVWDTYQGTLQALAEVTERGRLSSRSVGKRLGRFKDRTTHDGRRIVRRRVSGCTKWYVEDVAGAEKPF